MKASTGNFISNIEDFDHKFFSISPREAKSMDPQQRLLLHCAHHALEDSGYVPNATPSFNTETFGCYVGSATEDYVQNLRDEIDVYYSTGKHSFALRLFIILMYVDRHTESLHERADFPCYAMGWALDRR